MKTLKNYPCFIACATVKPPRGSLLKRVARFFSLPGRCPRNTQSCSNGIGVYPLFACDVAGYHAPCYPPNAKAMPPVPIDRGTLSRSYEINDNRI